jgi:hypothetical protein
MTRHPTANASQRARRKNRARIDYHPAPQALAIIRANMGPRYPDSILSGVLNRIVLEWAADRGQGNLINNQEIIESHTSGGEPEFPDAYARAYDFGISAKKQACPGQTICGARRHRDGQPCRARSEPGKRRCRFHGGRSTGPRSPQGKLRAQSNLRQNQDDH